MKILPGIRLNFSRRGISTSIGVRGAHVTLGKSGVRTTVGLPGSGLSYTHLERPHRHAANPPGPYAPAETGAPHGSAFRGLMWIGLIAVAVVFAINRPTDHPPVQVPAAAQPVPAARAAAQAAEASALAEIKTAALGVAQLRHGVANSNTLRFSRVTVMPKGVICYQFRLHNSRGVAYLRTAVSDGALLKTSGSAGYDSLWNSHCAHTDDGRDVTADVDAQAARAPNAPR